MYEHLIETGKVKLLQVQAGEIRAKAVGGVWWLAQAVEVEAGLGYLSICSPAKPEDEYV